MRPYRRFGWPPARDLDSITVGCVIEWTYEGQRWQAKVKEMKQGYFDLEDGEHPDMTVAVLTSSHLASLNVTGYLPLDERELDKLDISDVVIVSHP